MGVCRCQLWVLQHLQVCPQVLHVTYSWYTSVHGVCRGNGSLHAGHTGLGHAAWHGLHLGWCHLWVQQHCCVCNSVVPHHLSSQHVDHHTSPLCVDMPCIWVHAQYAVWVLSLPHGQHAQVVLPLTLVSAHAYACTNLQGLAWGQVGLSGTYMRAAC